MPNLPKIPDLDAGKSPQQLLAERAKRLQDAIELKQPDRIPIQITFGYMIAELGEITKEEFHTNPTKAQELLEQAALEYQPDTCRGFPFEIGMSQAVGDRMTKWPGYGLASNISFQFAESEFMKAEDYDHFLDDPSDWGIRVYMPRVFSELEGLANLFPLSLATFVFYNLPNLWQFSDPQILHALNALSKAIEASIANRERLQRSTTRLTELGFPPTPIKGITVEAPFDYMSDTLRGMRGIFLDLHQRPEKLLAAEQKVLRFLLDYVLRATKQTHNPRAFFPLHRGSDGFMSLAQFEKFYWPQLTTFWSTLIEQGITPIVFFEGTWDQRLKYLADLPKGKIVGMFQTSDIFKVKEAIGDTMCIVGGMPNSMLTAGTVEQVRSYTRKLCQEVGRNGGFIMSTTSSELEVAKPELVKAWVDATKEFGVY
jgi:uroporphyrinogen-III decarboxylase